MLRVKFLALRAVVADITSFLTETIDNFGSLHHWKGYLVVDTMIYTCRGRRGLSIEVEIIKIDGLLTNNNVHHLGEIKKFWGESLLTFQCIKTVYSIHQVFLICMFIVKL